MENVKEENKYFHVGKKDKGERGYWVTGAIW